MVRVNWQPAVRLVLGARCSRSPAAAAATARRSRGETAPNIVQPGAPGEPTRTLSAEELAEIEPPKYTEADVRFMQGMIHHHAQALRMTALVPARQLGRWPRLAREADRPLTGDRDRADAKLAGGARTKRRPCSIGSTGTRTESGSQGLMPGMLTERQLKKLAAARGKAFDRLFLELDDPPPRGRDADGDGALRRRRRCGARRRTPSRGTSTPTSRSRSPGCARCSPSFADDAAGRGVGCAGTAARHTQVACPQSAPPVPAKYRWKALISIAKTPSAPSGIDRHQSTSRARCQPAATDGPVPSAKPHGLRRTT